MAKNRDLLSIGHSAHDYIIRVPEFPKERLRMLLVSEQN